MYYAAVSRAGEIIIPPSQSTETAQAGSPTTASTLFPPPVMVPETTQLLTMKEDITSLPSIISFPAPISPPTESVVSETIMATSSTVHPVICAGAEGSYVPPNPTSPPTRRLFSPLTVITVPLTLQSVISAAPQGAPQSAPKPQAAFPSAVMLPPVTSQSPGDQSGTGTVITHHSNISSRAAI